MRYLMYTIGDDSTPLTPPGPEVMAEMGKFMEEITRAGVLVATGGIAPIAQGTTLRMAEGKFTVTDGPYTEAKEMIGGWAIIKVSSKAQALDWAKRFMKINGNTESRIREVFYPEDFVSNPG
jgi:hypothetical protein